MTIELPVLKLGLAGFSAGQVEAVGRMLKAAGAETNWEIADVDAADALWFNGERTQAVGPGRIRVAPGVPTGHSMVFQMADIDRPVAFAQPLAEEIHARCSFDLASRESVAAIMQQFEAWLAPLVAQFSLAAHIAEHQSALGSGCFELRLNSELLAVVDMHGDAAVRATARPEDFEAGAMWQRSRSTLMPEHFVRTTLSRLMWQFAVRTQSDLLPRHYRTGLIYFRRAPRLPQQSLKDSHLFIMRELMLGPATFKELMRRCGMDEERMARELAALYFVGTITSNSKRAAPMSTSKPRLDSLAPVKRFPTRPDLTAPAPLRIDH